jgi:carboxyl-terminal processing protease
MEKDVMTTRKIIPVLLTASALVAGTWGSSLPFPADGGAAQSAAEPGATLSTEVLGYVSRLYIEPERSGLKPFVTSALDRLETHYPEILASVDEDAGKATLRVDREKRVFDLPPEGSLLEAAGLLDDIVDFIAGHLSPPVDVEKLRYETLRGGLRSLDPHSRLHDPRSAGEFNARTTGSFGGVGFTVNSIEEKMTVLEVMPETPAARVGLAQGDGILAVDGTATDGMTVRDLVDRVRGEPGTEVTLTVSRSTWETPRKLTPTREVIVMNSVEKRILGDGKVPLLYLAVNRFQKDTDSQILRALNDAAEEEIGGLILDLRNNPGGLLDTAVKVSDIFLDDGFIVSIKKRSGISNVRKASMFGVVREQLPLVVLVNGGSASASEVVSAALKKTRALVVGERTFGKGSAQQMIGLSDGGGLVLTIAHYLTPGGVSIQSRGVSPDIVLSPVTLGKTMRLRPVDGRPRESLHENAFSPAERPGPNDDGEGILIEYRLEEGEGEPAAGKPSHPAAAGGAPAEDFAVRFAARMLRSEGSSSRKEDFLSRIGPLLEEVRREEQAGIEEAFSGLHISWTPPGDHEEEGTLEAGLTPDVVLQPGATVPLSLWVRNTGDTPLYRVWGRTLSDNPLLRNLDFAFGELAPGERRSATIELTVPASKEERWDAVDARIFSAAGHEGVAAGTLARTLADKAPDLAYSYAFTEAQANEPAPRGDAVMEAGERRLQLKVTVRNRGERGLEKVQVKTGPRTDSGLTIAPRSRSIARLGGEEEGEVTFDLRLPEDSPGETFEIPLSFFASDFGILLNDRIRIQAGEAHPTAVKRFPPRLTFGPVVKRTDSDRIELAVTAADDGPVKDVYAYRGHEKIFYARNAAGGPSFLNTLDIPLEEGLNRIMVFARDGDGIVSQKTAFVFRSLQESPSPPL